MRIVDELHRPAHGSDGARAGHAGAGVRDWLGPALSWLVALAAGAFAAALVTQIPLIAADGNLTVAWPWVERFGVTLAFRLDGLGMVMGLLISSFGAVIAIYAGSYLKGHPHLARFFLYFALFCAAMLGVVLSDDLILLFVFWEMTTVASYLLVGFDYRSAKARRNAWQALLVTGMGGLALLAGLVLLGIAAGTFRISEIQDAGSIAAHPAYPAILTLVLLGAFTKSAQVPFHFWLPGAMAAPTPVSAYLHSATMVKAGVYLIALLHPVLSGTAAWTNTLSAFGGTTMLLAAFLALRQTDLKLALAYTSVMALGSLMMFLGAEATVAIAAAMTFLIVHALYKAALFLVVGVIDHETGTREIARLGGLWRTMPMTSLAAVLAAGSMAGFPPFLGFIGKELKYEGALAIAEEPWPLAGAAVLANALMVTLCLVIILRVVFGPAGDTPKKPHEGPVRLWLPPLLLAGTGLAFGIAPDVVGSALVQPAVTVILGRPEEVALKLWHGVNVPLLMSIATVGLGITGFLLRRPLGRAVGLIPARSDAIWDGLLRGILASFKAVTRIVQPGSLRIYLSATFVVLAALPLGWLALSGGFGMILRPPGEVPPAAAGAALLVAAGALVAAVARRRMAAIGGLGAVGTGIAMLFVVFGAPDVAITQLLVDVLLVVLIAAVMSRLPDLGPRRTNRLADGAVAVLTGVAVTVLTLAATAPAFDRSVSDAMTVMSVPEAYGRNIVNVVLVDFRALDTFGEIVVVGAAAIGALALIRIGGRRRAAEGGSET